MHGVYVRDGGRGEGSRGKRGSGAIHRQTAHLPHAAGHREKHNDFCLTIQNMLRYVITHYSVNIME